MVMNDHSETTIAPAPMSTIRLCGSSAAPPIIHGSVPAKAGNEWKFLSNTMAEMPRRKIEAPMVMMISVTADAPRAGSIANWCSKSPTAVATTIASRAAIGSGTPAAAAKNVTMPPSMTNSPCAKLITSEAL